MFVGGLDAIPDDSGKLIVTVPKEFAKNHILYIVKSPYTFGKPFEDALKGTRVVFMNANDAAVVARVYGARVLTGPVTRSAWRQQRVG